MAVGTTLKLSIHASVCLTPILNATCNTCNSANLIGD